MINEINEALFDELKESKKYQQFRQHYILQAVYPVLLSGLFLIIMLLLRDFSKIMSVIPCVFMAIAVCVTGFYAIRAFKAPSIVERGTVKEVFMNTNRNGITEISYIVDVLGYHYRAVAGITDKANAKVYGKDDEVTIIVYGNSKMGYIL